jgi:hypothetical protein
MQSFLREKRAAGSVPTRREPKASLKGVDEGAGKFKLASWSRKSSQKLSPATSEAHHATGVNLSLKAKENGRATEVIQVGRDDFQAFKYTVRVAELCCTPKAYALTNHSKIPWEDLIRLVCYQCPYQEELTSF